MGLIIDNIANDLEDLGGHLECTVCHLEQPIGNIGVNLSTGWPKHCGYTMTWVTASQEALRSKT